MQANLISSKTCILLVVPELPLDHSKVIITKQCKEHTRTIFYFLLSLWILFLKLVTSGSLKKITAPKLGATAIKHSVEKVGLPLESVEEVIMGCVVQVNIQNYYIIQES